MPNYNYEDSDAYREQLVKLHDPRKCPLHIGDLVEFVHIPYAEAYTDGVVVDIEGNRAAAPEGELSYQVQVVFMQRGEPRVNRHWLMRQGLIRLKSAHEVLGEDYFD